MIDDIRQLLSDELFRRLKSLHIVTFEGDAGVWGEWGRQLPCIHIYEGDTEHELIKPGLYQVMLPISLVYVNRLADRKKINTEGRDQLQKIQCAIELDERFTDSVTGNDLVIKYSLVETNIVDILDANVAVGLTYEFFYADRFLGYEINRH